MWLSQKTAGKNGINAIIKSNYQNSTAHQLLSSAFFSILLLYMCVRVMLYMYIYTHTGKEKGERESIFILFISLGYVGMEFLGYTAVKLGIYKDLMKDSVSCSFVCSVFLFYLLGTLAEKLQTFLTSRYFIKTVSPSVSTLLCYQVTRESDKGICVNVSQHTLLTQAYVQHWK